MIFRFPCPEIKQPDEVLIRVKEVGLDGTDFNMLRHGVQDIAENRNDMAMGHEVVEVAEAVGSEVKSIVPGDPVAVTVHRAAKKCHLDIDFYAHQRWDIHQKLPWAILDSGTEQSKLELNRALSQATSTG